MSLYEQSQYFLIVQLLLFFSLHSNLKIAAVYFKDAPLSS